MNATVKKYLLCGSTLLCLGAVSAGLLAGVNLVTAPIIAEANEAKASAAYQEVFPAGKFSAKQDFSSEEDRKALQEAGLTPNNVDYYVTAYEDDAKTKEIGKVFHGQIAGRDAALELLVGFAMENGKASLVKIAMVQCNDSFKSKFIENYLNPVNAGERSFDDVAGVGATITSTAVSKVVSEANKLFSALSGGIVEYPEAWNKALFGEKGYKLSSSAKEIQGNEVFSKYYSLYDDPLGHNEAARFYVGQIGDFASAIAVSEEGFQGGYILSSSFSDVDYKATPSFASSSLPQGETGNALSSMGEKAVEALSKDPLKTLSSQAIGLFEGGKTAVKTELNLALPPTIANLGIDEYRWPSEKKQILYATYAIYGEGEEYLGNVYEAEFHVVKDEEGADGIEAHGGLYFLLGFSGEDIDNPTLTDVLSLENSFSKASVLQKYCIDVFNKGEDHSFSAFKKACGDGIKVGNAGIDATISSHALYAVADFERQQYAKLKNGGK